jgi:hypothetical protein
MEKSSFIKTGDPAFDSLIPTVKGFLEKDLQVMNIDGQEIRGYRSPDAPSVWIRDYSDMLRGIRYFEDDVKSVVSHFADTQSANGRIFDYFCTNPEKLPCEKENWTKYVRVPVEADVEYRFVKSAWLAWQACGDDEWVRRLMPNLEAALRYSLNHPHRFDQASGLIKRPYTIDTWDFAYTAGSHDWLQFQIDDNTYWGIFHGDNSGIYEALRIMELLTGYFDMADKALYYSDKAEMIRQACNRTCWNGSFYSHFVKLTPIEIAGVDEGSQISMSNPMAINRGITSLDQSRSIISEYGKRWEQKQNYFAEWFSIDPPFPDGIFGDEKLKAGAYINGGIFPLAGGELAKAAFNSGLEIYGTDILRRYYKLLVETGGSWLWYFPDGSPSTSETSTSPEASSTDGWGSTAMLDALVSGLAGVEDRSKLFREPGISPRWTSAGIKDAHVRISYKASGDFIEYKYREKPDVLELNVTGKDCETEFHVLLPGGKTVGSVLVEGKGINFSLEKTGESRYLNFHRYISKPTFIEIKFQS